MTRSEGNNFEIATVRFVADYVDIVSSIMMERGFSDLTCAPSTGGEESEIPKMDNLKL